MSKKFGPAFDGLPFGKKGPGSDFMKRFESVKMNFRKPAFNRSKKRMYELPLRMPKARDCENYDEEEAMVRIAWSTIEGFFQPVVTQVLDLVSEQVMQVSDTSILSANKMRLVMTGGFADSDYLFEALQDWNEAGGQSFDIFRAERGEAAIAVGAAIRGLSGSGSHPVSRKCRQHYALGLGLKFNRDLDDIKNTYIDQFDGRRMTPACLMWKIAKVSFQSLTLRC